MRKRSTKRWDLFISHASEDKKDFVEPLANALAEFGLRVWYDKFTLKPGDSLSRSIDLGLASSKYGLIVLSPAFVSKKWPEYELRGLTARELAGGKVILPIWYNISQSQLLRFSPPLADKLAIKADKLTPVQIAVEVVRHVRPEIFSRIMRRIAHYESLDSAETVTIDPGEIRLSPIQHQELSPELIGRIRLVRACLLGVHTHSMKVWMDGFQRDSHPSSEIAVWEKIAAVFREYCAMTRGLTPKQYRRVFELVLMLSFTDDEHELLKNVNGLPEDALTIVSRLYAHDLPSYDFDDKTLPDGREHSGPMHNHDKEQFPQDLPEPLVRKFMKERRQAHRKA